MRSRTAYLYILPAFILLGLFAYWPFLAAMRLSLYNSDGLMLNDFVGFANFIELAQDPLLYESFKVLGCFFLALPFQVFGPFLGAKLIHSVANRRAALVYRFLLVLPVVIPAMTGVLIWRDLYSPDGAVNRILRGIGLAGWTTTWLGDSNTVIGALVFMGMPWVGGVAMLLYLAGFLNIPLSHYQAARIDGASSWQVLRHIEMPAVIPQFRVVLVLATLGLIQSYDAILVLTNGGPGNSTLVPGLLLFRNGFEYGRLGYASAIGFVLFALCLVLTLINLRLLRRDNNR